ncbi:MBL fold metallo-hydrolase [Paraburkholderia unamae]|uniref:Glyoxylase-like metal-dependent hydrolase (Beta-lactamase superfamily II) n=1 Tax=Paraburkholderia unamae TaxID=219649 RepID=A0ABX5KQK8_9BURK|nr:MBL fold metallo-hydrolase [Paraburkholderia unamae]PVX82950.1 glyoxylase-like metal-dependent hydrolase (beta-lactamase superfamily II) [Paraburkholderia unamae]
MTERTDDTENSARVALRYPFAEPPAPGTTLEVAPGVRWLRMPLPYELDHINVWLVDEADGCAVIDTGTRTDAATAVWRSLCAQTGEARAVPRVTRVFVTHMHPDHVGMAGWLTRAFGCRLWMTRTEYFNCRVAASDTGREAPADALDFYRRAGWSESAIDVYRARFGRFGQHIHPLPDSFRRMQDGDVVRIGAHDWRVIVGMGHSPEHACLYCPALKLFISGDQVLPRISSNVSVYPIEPDANPMAQWYASLDKLQNEVPDDVLVLPAHNDCFYGLHARIERLRRGQDKSFDRLRATLAQPRRAVDVFGALFARRIGEDDLGQMSLATGESLACLNYLIDRGEVQRELREDGVFWYSLA